MNLKDKIELLMKKNNISSIYQLSINSNIPYSTLKSIFSKNSDITISTAKKLCKYFKLSFDELLNDEIRIEK